MQRRQVFDLLPVQVKVTEHRLIARHCICGLTTCGTVPDRLAESPVVGFDEIGLRVARRLHWVCCTRTDQDNLITCHPQRGLADYLRFTHDWRYPRITMAPNATSA